MTRNGKLKKTVRLTVPATLPDSLDGTLLKYLDQKLLNSAAKVITIDSVDYYYFIDGWGRPLIYRIPGKFNKTGFDLGSVGPDGKVGDGQGSVITETALPSASDYESYFGQGDDITNVLRN